MPKKTIYIVDDEKHARDLLNILVQKWGYTSKLFINGESCIKSIKDGPDLVFLDIMMPDKNGLETLKEIKDINPDLPVIILSAQGKIDTVVESMKLGAIDYFTKPFDISKLEIATRNALKLHDLTEQVKQLKETVERSIHFDNIVTNHGSMFEVFNLVQKVRDNEICVLIQGESGTGKELIAQAVHFNGKRKNGPFVILNCASIPRDLLESEMFGHERGAFTGAFQKRIGRFEQADTGTIFLDEISEIDLGLQVKLLRVIQTKQFDRVGGNETIKSDVRIISSTNKDLKQAVRQKEFREDLYYRLAAFPIFLPPLRERDTDITLLAEHFLTKFSRKLSKTINGFTEDALILLNNYHWPGNVRELENLIERAVILSESNLINNNDLPLTLNPSFSNDQSTSKINSPSQDDNIILPLEKVEEEALRKALQITKGNISETARKLQISRLTIYRLMKKYDIHLTEP